MKKNSFFFTGLIFLSFCAVQCTSSEKNQDLQGMPDFALALTTVRAEIDGRVYRDLNSNGKLDVYEDSRQPVDARITDLVGQMNLEEKAGMMFIEGVPVNEDGSLEKKEGTKGPGARRPAAIDNIRQRKITSFNVWEIPADPVYMAKWNNNLQQFAEQTRLGIPVTIASDPRHHFSKNIFSIAAQGFSQFCETFRFAAIGNDSIVQAFADLARREYLAVGLREALHPQVDLATEPRWSRINGGFGEDAHLSARMVKAYLAGMQGESLKDGVACMTKHFPGGGPQKEGLDPHFPFQKGQVYPGGNFDYHLIPFEAAIESKTSAIMPYYGVPVGQTGEEVAMAFNQAIITGLLREKYQYDGVVCTDWGLITDAQMGPDIVWPARSWGLEGQPAADRVLKVIEAGCDQFGGESRPELIVQLVQEGRLPEERVDLSVRRILKQKFELGLFDNPFVDVEKVKQVMATPESLAFGEMTQRKSMTLLKNEEGLLPLKKDDLKIYIENMDSSIVAGYAKVVDSPEEADLAIIRLNTPWIPVETDIPFARGFHHGDLDFKGTEKEHILGLLQKVPTIVNIYLDRPAVIPEIAAMSKALIADYGASDKSVCEVLFGLDSPEGKLPFELPSSMEAVRNQKEDLPHDSENPLYPFGFGLTY